MGSKVTFDYSKADAFISVHEMESMKKITEAAKAELLGREGAGNDFLGWIDLPVDYDKDEFARIKKAAAKIQSDSDVLLVIGIGGSYLGARAAIEFLTHSFYNVLGKKDPADLLCGQQHQQQVHQGSAGCSKRQGFLHQHHFQVGYHNGAGDCIPCIQGDAD